MSSKFGDSLRRYRESKGITQAEMADSLGISQGHLSKLEKGQIEPSRSLYLEVTRRTGGSLEAIELKAESTSLGADWSISCFVFPEPSSGDRICVSSKTFEDKFAVLHCDAAGTGAPATQMATYLEMGFHAVIEGSQQASYNTQYAYLTLDRMVKATRKHWRGNQSGFLLSALKSSSEIELLNCGMPEGYLFHAREKRISSIGTVKSAPIGDFKGKNIPEVERIRVDKGDILFLASDGFHEEFNRSSSQGVKAHFNSIAIALKSDIEGVSNKLLRNFSEYSRNAGINDDLSFVMISKAQ